MKKFSSRFFTVLLILSFVIPSFTFISCKNNEPLTLSIDEYYISNVTEAPSTVEATVLIKNHFPFGEIGTIISNYNKDNAYFTIYLNGNGIPVIEYQDIDGVKEDLRFNFVAVPLEQNTHLAFTFNYEENNIQCYLNGILKQTISPKDVVLTNNDFETPFSFFGDSRLANTLFFKGSIINASAYSDIRNNEEITKDIESTKKNFDENNIIFYYTFKESNRGKNLLDSSDNKNTLNYKDGVVWVDKPNFDSAYSFALIGDTQYLNYYFPDYFAYPYDYIIKNKDKLNTKFVFGLGDITDKSQKEEYQLSMKNIDKLDGVIPYSVIRGNHDKISDYDRYFTFDKYGHIVDGSFDGTMKNTYKKLVINNTKFLIINIDYGCKLDVLNEMSNLISNHQDYNVILTTHAYLYHKNLLKEGQFIWDNLAKKHKNIVMVLSGHCEYENLMYCERIGDNGNVVHEFMVDPQLMDRKTGPTGMITYLDFLKDGKTVQVSTYSSVYGKYFMKENQFQFSPNLI